MSGRKAEVSAALTPPRLTLDLQSRAVRTLVARDFYLARLVDRYGPPPLWDRPAGFATLVRIILEQQVSLASAAAMFHRLERELQDGVPPAAILEAGPDGLRRLGLTRQKTQYVIALADRVASGELRLLELAGLSDRDALAQLTRVPGIGPWTASIYLLMALLRPDVWPVGDLALHRMLANERPDRGKLTNEQAEAVAHRWRPWRAVAARILWHAYLSGSAIAAPL